MRAFLFFYIFLCDFYSASGQSLAASESVVKYDLITHKTDKPIPFDRPFTLTVEKLPIKAVDYVEAYEAGFYDGKRDLVYTIFNCDVLKPLCERYDPARQAHRQVADNMAANPPRTTQKIEAVKDVDLRFKLMGDTLQIFIPALKPNKAFDINIAGFLSASNITALMEVNALLADGRQGEAAVVYKKLRGDLFDRQYKRSYFAVSLQHYVEEEFEEHFLDIYRRLANPANFPAPLDLRAIDVQAIDRALAAEEKEYNDAHFFTEMIKANLFKEVQRGQIDIVQIYQPEKVVSSTQIHLREQNLLSTRRYFDSMQIKIVRLLSKGSRRVNVGRTVIDLEDVHDYLEELRFHLLTNHKNLSDAVKLITARINGIKDARQGFYLSAQTVASDLKTASGSVLFLDAGLSNLIVPGVTKNIVNIPRLYWGVSVYFRPIDKNTRRDRFPKSFDPAETCGCNAKGKRGPDYGIVSKWSVLQHLSLNIGFTVGTLPNKDYENLYNNVSLLVGPAWRFARAFKFSGGLALIRRSSKSPLVSDKGVVAGAYVGLSSDIDFLQGIKDITNLLFK